MKICKSKHFGKKVSGYEDNPERRVHCPEWSFYPRFHNKLISGAKENSATRSHFFERVVMNFFLLENPVFEVSQKNNYSCVEKVKGLRKLTLHPSVIELINQYSKQSNTRPSRYLTLLFDKYYSKYDNEIDLKKLLV